ncbi:hemopexin repeat-containing protein [Streptomyces sp. NPDC003006]
MIQTAALTDYRDKHQGVSLFRADEYAVYAVDEDKLKTGPAKVAADWSGLAGTQFADNLDAITSVTIFGAGQFDFGEFYAYLFKGDQYIRYDLRHSRIDVGPLNIGEHWPGLKEAGFDRDLDTVLYTWAPGGLKEHLQTSYAIHFFKGDQYVTFDLGANKVTSGPKKIAAGWPGLKAGGFDSNLDASVLTWTLGRLPGMATDRKVYFFKGDRYIRFDLNTNNTTHSGRAIADGWPGLKGTDFAAAEDLPRHQPAVAQASCTFTFSNPGEADPDPYGSIWLKTKDGTIFRLWTQANLGNSTPLRRTLTNSISLPFGADDITEVCAHVDEYDMGNGDDYLARGSQPFTGNGTYTLTSEDGSVTVELTLT